MPYYYTDHNKFYNPLAMFAYAAIYTPHTFPVFDCYDDEFSKFDWSKEPEASWESLLEARAVQLRCKYDRLVLYFSGGTDSTTIYRIFKKLNIHIDEIVIMYFEDNTKGNPIANVKWLIDNHYDSTTIITVSEGSAMQIHKNEECMLDPNRPINVANFFGGTQDHRYFQIESGRFNNYNVAYIIGAEKPTIMIKDNKLHATLLDRTLASFLHENSKVEWFFITPDLPELHIKQCHMLKNNIRRCLPDIQSNWVSSEFAAKSAGNYLLHANWCGRTTEISSNASFTQKEFYVANPINTLGLLRGGSNYASDNPAAKGIVNAFKSVQTDSTIIEYLTNIKLLNSNSSIDNYNGIWSLMFSLES